MSTIAVNNITDEQGSGRPAFSNGVQTSNINGGQVGGRRNLIINGDMRVAQRGTSFTFTGQDFDYGWVDRWTCSFNSTSTYEQVSTSMDAFEYATRITLGSGESGSQIRQRIETPAHISLKTLTLSWYAKASAELDQYVYATREDGPEPYDFFEEAFSEKVTTQWQRFSVTFTVDYDITGKNYDVQIGLSNASGGDTYDITGVQLEVGDTATEFEHRSYGEELALCQRYFENVDIGNNGMTFSINKFGSSSRYRIYFKTTKRALPSVSSPINQLTSYGVYNVDTDSNTVNMEFTSESTDAAAISIAADDLTSSEAVAWVYNNVNSSPISLSADAEL